MKNAADISVIVATYNPDPFELIRTLNSIVYQQGVNIEIVIADDGSKNDITNLLERYFLNVGFTQYQVVNSKKNLGTVNNIMSGIRACSGQYVKTISPGDCLFDQSVLCNWLEHIRSSGNTYSFGDAVCYRMDQNEVRTVKRHASPQNIKLIQKGNVAKIRKNHLLFGDAMNGAAILTEKDMFAHYLSQIAGKVIYCEDMAFDLMMYDGIVPSYFPHEVILYEVGTGISTKGNKAWNQRLEKDRRSMTEILLEQCEDPVFYKKYQAAIGAKWTSNKSDKLKKYLYNPSIIFKRIKIMFCPRMTSEKQNKNYLELIWTLPKGLLETGDIQ